MKDRLFFIICVGVAFYAGMKLTKSKVVIKEVVKPVIVNEGPTISYVAMQDELKACVAKYDALVEEANSKVKDLEAQIDICEERYIEKPHENLYPEEVEIDLESIAEKGRFMLSIEGSKSQGIELSDI